MIHHNIYKHLLLLIQVEFLFFILDINDQSSTSIENQQKDNPLNDEKQTDEQWQQPRGNANTRGQFNNGNRGYNRGGQNPYHQQRRGPRKSFLF
jgi:hypothetical protein